MTKGMVIPDNLSHLSHTCVFEYEYQRILHKEKIRQELFGFIQNQGVFEKIKLVQSTSVPDINNKVKKIVKPKLQWNERLLLKAKIREAQYQIHQRAIEANAIIIQRTRAHNRKCSYVTVKKERAVRADVASSQIQAWCSLLPTLIRKLSQIKDPRRVECIKHKLTMLMIFGLMAFVFKLTSRREINRELTGALVHQHLQKIFPDLDSIPHADTLARMLEKINPHKIEFAHIELIKELISKKKFKKLLIHHCIPITIDGSQKLYRDGVLQDGHWCERTVGLDSNNHTQQYVYVIEANRVSLGSASKRCNSYLKSFS